MLIFYIHFTYNLHTNVRIIAYELDTNIIQIRYKMQIPEKIITRWFKLYDRGDKPKIIKETGLDHRVVYSAFEGEATEEVINKIDDFFKAKEERINSRIA